jgi:hypothetical protein
MTHVRIIVEYCQPAAAGPLMRWERTARAAPLGVAAGGPSTGGTVSETFELLGRAFEVAQREEGAPFREGLVAFFKGALVRNEDLADVVAMMREENR